MRFLIELVVPVALVLLVPVLAAAVPPVPTFGTAVVDGQYREWNLTADFFADMYRAGKPDKPLESKLYLRYDCDTNTMYALLLVESGVVGYIDSDSVAATTAWVAISAISNKVVNETSGDDGIAPDFAWVGQGYDGDPHHAQGYEASFHILPGTYFIIAHIDVWDAGLQTSATDGGFPHSGPALVIPECTTAAEPTSLGTIKALYR